MFTLVPLLLLGGFGRRLLRNLTHDGLSPLRRDCRVTHCAYATQADNQKVGLIPTDSSGSRGVMGRNPRVGSVSCRSPAAKRRLQPCGGLSSPMIARPARHRKEFRSAEKGSQPIDLIVENDD